MTTPSQLETVRKEIDNVKAQILETKGALAAARRDADVDILRKQLEQLNQKENILREEKNILLQGQASGQHWLPWHQGWWLFLRSCIAAPSW